MLPKEINRKNINIDHERFYARIHIYNDNKAYVQAFLTYDNETFDVKDDIVVIALPFIVEKELIDSELQYYEGEGYVDFNFSINCKE